jgi:imidazolonepropionase-like amidohydrolase
MGSENVTTDRQQSAGRGALALVGATMIDGTGDPPLPDAVVLIADGQIRAVGPRSDTRVPQGFERRDLKGMTLLPGLIDSHVHLSLAN